jgi:hypothetical protein
MISTNANAVSAPTPGCVCNRRASGHFSTSPSMASVSSAIVGVSRSSSCRRSRRRRLAQGANASDSSCSRPASRHSRFLQRSPSLSATACSWFMIRVRACTIRCRSHSSCRRSRFSELGTQIRGKRSSRPSRAISTARLGTLERRDHIPRLGRKSLRLAHSLATCRGSESSIYFGISGKLTRGLQR